MNKNMEKKVYIAPAMELIEMELMSMLAASAVDIPVVDGEGSDMMSNDRRGSWGNLWN